VSAAGTAPKTLVIVTAPPSGSFAVAGAKSYNGVLYTNSKTPTLTLSFSDPGGISTVAVSTNGGTSYGAAQAYGTSIAAGSLANGDGSYTIVVKLTDVAGNVGTYSLTVRLQTAGPTINSSLSAPQATIGYDGTANITASYSATDPTTISSLTAKLDGASFTGTVINVYTLLAGQHTLVITAVDGLGNSSSVTMTFNVRPSLTGLQGAVNAGASAGAITNTEKTKLLGYLGSQTKANLTSFLNEVKAQSGHAITAAEATLLTSWGNDLYGRTTV
jgi:hypothetical protein